MIGYDEDGESEDGIEPVLDGEPLFAVAGEE